MNYIGDIYRPPSEAYSLILQVSVGCAHNTCTFCDMYKAKRFYIKDDDVIERDLKEAASYYGNRALRIFLADGDALVLPMKRLRRILMLCRKYFPYAERISSYGSAEDILKKTADELKELKDLGLEMIYLGAESGSEKILKHVKKRVSVDDMALAGRKLKEAGMLSSVTIISGLGGQALLREHAIASADLISRMKPDYLGFMTLMLPKGTPMYAEVERGEMKMLTPEQVMEEQELFLNNVDSEGTVFRSTHASNYLALRGTLNKDIPKLLESLKQARKEHRFRKEYMRGL